MSSRLIFSILVDASARAVERTFRRGGLLVALGAYAVVACGSSPTPANNGTGRSGIPASSNETSSNTAPATGTSQANPPDSDGDATPPPASTSTDSSANSPTASPTPGSTATNTSVSVATMTSTGSSTSTSITTSTGTSSSTSTSGTAGILSPAFIFGADISWETQHESQGYTYSDGTSTKSQVAIMAENGFNFIRLRTMVNPAAPGGYSSQGYCGKADTVTMAKRAKDCGLGVYIDFHMSDTWQSLGTNANASAMPRSWVGLDQTVPSTPVSASTHLTNNLYQAAHDYVADVMQALVAAGAKPDMVQIGNETNTGMSGIPISNWSKFSALVNAGIRAVRETDPAITVWAQNGRPRPDSAGGSNFTGWVDEYLSGKAPNTPAIDEDGICGSTYGTTNMGADWTSSFSYVVDTYKKPVMSCECDDGGSDSPASHVINAVMRAFPNGMGRGSFIWEPADYPSLSGSQTDVSAGRLFTLSGKVYTTNSNMPAYAALAKSYGLPVPAGNSSCK